MTLILKDEAQTGLTSHVWRSHLADCLFEMILQSVGAKQHLLCVPSLLCVQQLTRNKKKVAHQNTIFHSAVARTGLLAKTEALDLGVGGR